MSTDVFSTVRDRISAFLGVTHQGARDMYRQFGYTYVITPDQLLAMYLRNGIANRIIRTFPKATWREAPTVWDEQGNSPEEGSSFSEFSASVDKLCNTYKVYNYLERADRVSGVGRYGLLVMGFRDGLKMDQPLEKGKHPLLYLGVYGETNIDVNQWDTNVASPRYGMPVLYTVRTGNLSGLVSSGEPAQKRSFTVHHTRVLHLAEQLDEDEVFSVPRLLPVFNWLQDLEKTAGASAETFWLNARAGLALSADKDANFTEAQLTDMKNQALEYEHQLRRMLALQGITPTPLTAEVADPEPNIEKLLDLIAGTCEIPKRILIGSERGELSSSQDENNFAARVQERSTNYAGPCILKPFLQRMIDTQNVSEPQGEWGIDWPSAGQTPEQAANIGTIRSATLRNYVMSPGAELIVPPSEFRREFLSLPSEPDTEDQLEEEELLGDEIPIESEAPAEDDSELGGDEDGVTPPDQNLDNVSGNGKDEEASDRLTRMTAGLAHWDLSGGALETMQRLALKANKSFSPKTLYLCRRVLNADDLMRWARKAGFSSMLSPDDLHVTIAFSKTAIDWMRIPESWTGKEDGTLVIQPGGPRIVSCLGNKNAVVLFFNSSELCWRHETIKHLGASWPHDDYQPHMTLTYDEDELDLEDVVPYDGRIVLGPEEFKEVCEDWSEGVQELSL